MLVGIAIEIPFAIGEDILGVEAYFIRDWKTLQIVAYLPLLCEIMKQILGLAFIFSIVLYSAAWTVLCCA